MQSPNKALLITRAILLFSLVICATSSVAAQKQNAKITRIADRPVTAISIAPDGSQTIGAASGLATAIQCVSRHDSGAVWAIGNWILGNELYKSYQDPVAACGGAYPYSIETVHFVLQIASAATITVALDIEEVDLNFLPGCPVPGNMLYLGALTDITFPSAGLYDVAIALDTPQVVDAPFFVGFFFATLTNPAWGLSLVTDSFQVPCVSYNIWDTTLGYIDLGDNLSVHQSIYPSSDPCFNAVENSASCFGFDGRVLLYTSGVISESTGCCLVAGDANHDGRKNIADITFMIDRIFSGGPPPVCSDEFDANSDNRINVTDITYMIAHIFQGQAGPICGTTGG
jgi:Dockerin type I domain